MPPLSRTAAPRDTVFPPAFQAACWLAGIAGVSLFFYFILTRDFSAPPPSGPETAAAGSLVPARSLGSSPPLDMRALGAELMSAQQALAQCLGAVQQSGEALCLCRNPGARIASAGSVMLQEIRASRVSTPPEAYQDLLQIVSTAEQIVASCP